jgi:hypothetical protein
MTQPRWHGRALWDKNQMNPRSMDHMTIYQFVRLLASGSVYETEILSVKFFSIGSSNINYW